MNTLKIWLLQTLTKHSKKECTYAFYGAGKSFVKSRDRLTLTFLFPQELQAIFDLVIEKGYYSGEKDGNFMCIALSKAYYCGVITRNEMVLAKENIEDYLGFHSSLEEYLRSRLLPHTPTARMAIYKNWSARP